MNPPNPKSDAERVIREKAGEILKQLDEEPVPRGPGLRPEHPALPIQIVVEQRDEALRKKDELIRMWHELESSCSKMHDLAYERGLDNDQLKAKIARMSRDYDRKCDELHSERNAARLRAQAMERMRPLCPDHRDKAKEHNCLLCEIETQSRQIATLDKAVAELNALVLQRWKETEALTQENAKLREELDDANTRFHQMNTPTQCEIDLTYENDHLREQFDEARNEIARLKGQSCYRVEQQQPATVEQGEWKVVELECPE